MTRRRTQPIRSNAGLWGSFYLLLAVGWFAVGNAQAAQTEKAFQELMTRGETHWAFQPVKRPALPVTKDTSWARNPLDTFVLAKIEAQGLTPAPAADRETYIRRVTYDLTGLPPTLEELDAFLADTAPGAKARLVDRLLESPRYGERWGRHWLDVARFAETDGFEHDAIRPHAWRYRDYVVRSFNADKPYDRFVREQMAGDELYPEEREALIATAFHLLGPDMVDSADQIQRRLNRLNDMTDTSALVFLGLTVGCARCHDHMFEPISQRDYYRLQSFFTPAKFRDDLPIPTDAQKEAHAKATDQYDRQVDEIKQELARLEKPYRARLREERLQELSEEARAAHATPKAQRTELQIELVKSTESKLKLSEKEILAAMPKEERAKHEALRGAIDRLPAPDPLPMTMALLQDKEAGAKTHVLFRGDYQSPREEVTPAAPGILDPPEMTQGRRKELADWMVSPDNPLTARVMANRIWLYHFGRGLVPTPSDFGLNGMPPTHPRLLDWLAAEFMAGGWSVKAMHRLILLSATYGQSSEESQATRRADPDHRLYASWQRKRLEGEAIRDSLLFVSQRLNQEAGGPGVQPPIPRELFEGAKGWKASPDREDHLRRSIYIFARRNLRYPFLEVFDAPDSNLSCARRGQSTTAPQSLTLLNADDVMRASEATAELLARETSEREIQVRQAFRRVLGREPSRAELSRSLAFLETSPLSELMRVLFNLNAFVYLD